MKEYSRKGYQTSENENSKTSTSHFFSAVCCCTYICDCGFQFRIKLQPGLSGTSLISAVVQ